MDRIIVSRHPAAVEFIARELTRQDAAAHPGETEQPGESRYDSEGYSFGPKEYRNKPAVRWFDFASGCFAASAGIPVLASATPDDVRGRIVYGNLPLHLAALAAEVVAIEFAGTPPRGQEYTLADMDAAGARLVRYRVESL